MFINLLVMKEELVFIVNKESSLIATMSFIETFCKDLRLNLQKTGEEEYTVEVNKDLYIEISNRMVFYRSRPSWLVTASEQNRVNFYSCSTFKEALEQSHELEESGYNTRISFGYII